MRLRVVLLFHYDFAFIDYLWVLEYHLVPVGVETVAKVLVNLVGLNVLSLDKEGWLGVAWLVLQLLIILVEEESHRSLILVHSQSWERFIKQPLVIELHRVVSLNPYLLSTHGMRHQSFERFPLESQESANWCLLSLSSSQFKVNSAQFHVIQPSFLQEEVSDFIYIFVLVLDLSIQS